MTSWLPKAAVVVSVVYLGIVATLFFLQRQVLFPAPRHGVPPPPGFTEVRYATADGLELNAAYRPASAGKPTVVFFHGNGDNWNGAAAATLAWVAAGYGVMLPEYRGYSGNAGSPSKDGLVADGHAALDWLAKQGIAGNQLVIIGNSIGSGVAIPAAAGRAPRALILVSPFASIPDLAAETFPWLPAWWLVRDRFDNCAAIRQVSSPVLILHGRDDELIPFSHAERLAACLPHAKLNGFAGAGHGLAYRSAAQEAGLAWLGESGAR